MSCIKTKFTLIQRESSGVEFGCDRQHIISCLYEWWFVEISIVCAFHNYFGFISTTILGLCGLYLCSGVQVHHVLVNWSLF